MNTNLEQTKKQEIEAKFNSFFSRLTIENSIEFVAETIHADFICLVEQIMKEQGLSYKELAEKLGTSKGYVSQLFSGKKLVNLEMIARLQKVLDIHFEIVPRKKITQQVPVNLFHSMWSKQPNSFKLLPSYSNLEAVEAA